MRTIVHLSDLHFGRIDPAVVEALAAAVPSLRPDLVAISGDLTQRAREPEFRQASAFLRRLPQPQIVVPGNHDVPLDNLVKRFLEPLTLYRRYIANDLEPFFADNEMAVAGVNTARSLTWKGGRINAGQVLRTFEKLCVLDERMIKIVVTHHPFDLSAAHSRRKLVGRAPMAMARFSQCGADVFLAGHMHQSYTGHTAARYRIAGYAALVVQAGTATSTRGRGERNSFNVLRLAYPRVTVDRYTWAGRDFARSASETFERAASRMAHWSPLLTAQQ
jgi:3',5'-cyclic AMP phosphodiesterase CpdA